jgi:hypothetical protein
MFIFRGKNHTVTQSSFADVSTTFPLQNHFNFLHACNGLHWDIALHTAKHFYFCIRGCRLWILPCSRERYRTTNMDSPGQQCICTPMVLLQTGKVRVPFSLDRTTILIDTFLTATAQWEWCSRSTHLPLEQRHSKLTKTERWVTWPPPTPPPLPHLLHPVRIRLHLPLVALAVVPHKLLSMLK